jgi:NAD(P)-dependent dehydrogenase (short-subunit alcohol dehydrogenase family)
MSMTRSPGTQTSDRRASRPAVLITGASTGLGRACAIHVVREGWLVFAGVRSERDARAVESDARQDAGAKGELVPVMLDVTSAQHIAGADGLRGLVNNAGVGVFGPVEFVSIDDWRRQFEINFFGQIAVTQAMLPLLRTAAAGAGPRAASAGTARIVLMSSIAGLVGQPILGPYSASKRALESLGDTLRLELASQRIEVSLVEPGAIRSEIWRKGQEAAQPVPQDTPMGRLYGRAVESVRAKAAIAERDAIPAERVAKVVYRAAGTDPRARWPRCENRRGHQGDPAHETLGSIPRQGLRNQPQAGAMDRRLTADRIGMSARCRRIG